MKTAVIIIDFGNFENTRECLLSLHQCQTKEQTIIYVAGQEDRVSELFPGSDSLGVVYVPLDKNGGFAHANNQAMLVAEKEGCDTYVLLNNDTLVKGDFLPPLVKIAHQKGVGLVSPKVYFAPGFEFHNKEYTNSEQGKVIWYAGGIIDWDNIEAYHWGVDEVDHGQFPSSETDFATGCCMAFSKQTLHTIGYMNEDYFLYLEDVDWSLKAEKYSLKVMYESASVIWHKNAGSTGGSGSPLQNYYQHRNRLQFGIKHAPLRSKLALIKHYLLRYQKESPGVKKAVIDGLLFKKGIREDI